MSTDPLFMRNNVGEYFWYHNDHLGTPQMMTTSSGAVVWKAKYTAFGKATVDPSSTVDNPLRFPGQYKDVETGLYYNRFRYYNPEIGRYLREDPIGFWGGINHFVYVSDDPANLIDPNGLLPRWMWKVVEKKWPQVIENSKIAINNVTNKAFSPDDLEKMKALILDEIGMFEAKAFSEVDPYTNPLVLTQKQRDILDDLLKRLLAKEKLTTEEKDLVKKAKDEYGKAFTEGKCIVK